MSLTAAAAAAEAVWAGRTVAGMDLPTVMLAIAGAETGGTWDDACAGDAGIDPQYGTCSGQCGGRAVPGATSWGLWQVHNVHAQALQRATGSSDPCAWAQYLYVPLNCASFANGLIPAGRHLTAAQLGRTWTTWWSDDGGVSFGGYGQGSWRIFYDTAAGALSVLRTAGAPPPSTVPAGLAVVAAGPAPPAPGPQLPTTEIALGAGLLLLALFGGVALP